MKLKNYSRPIVAITGPDKGGEAAWVFTAFSVLLNGGKPRRIHPGRLKNTKHFDALIIGGGADVNPKSLQEDDFYGYLDKLTGSKRGKLFRKLKLLFTFWYLPLVFVFRKIFSLKRNVYDEKRDKLELRVLKSAIDKNIPVLGICRGAQLINLFFKGTLHEEIKSFYTERPSPRSILPVKDIELKQGSKLHSVFGTHNMRVNALHHQAVKTNGQGIDVVGWERNRIVQAIESVAHDFLLGVQWHPEYLMFDHHQRKLFKALVMEGKKSMALA